jgi:hypothetical protein
VTSHNYTPIPNYLIDEVLRAVDPYEWAIITFVCRRTLGWQKSEDQISLTQFEKGTGLSRRWVITKLLGLTGRGLLRKSGDSAKGYVYGLNLKASTSARCTPALVHDVHQSDDAASAQRTPELVHIRHKSGAQRAPTKEIKKKESNSLGRRAPKATQLPEHLTPNEKHVAIAEETGISRTRV